MSTGSELLYIGDVQGVPSPGDRDCYQSVGFFQPFDTPSGTRGIY